MSKPTRESTNIERHFAKMAQRMVEIEEEKAARAAFEQAERERGRRMNHIEPYRSPMQAIADKARADIAGRDAETKPTLRSKLRGFFKW